MAKIVFRTKLVRVAISMVDNEIVITIEPI